MPIPISPAPVTSFGVSGGTSGIVGSGTNSNFINPSSPDWFVETQTLTVEYFRIPGWASVTHLTANDFALDSVGLGTGTSGVATGYIQYTNLLVKISAEYKVEKQRNLSYGTSSFAQPQKFTCYPVSSDHIKSYGTPASGTLGPRGKILTTQRYEYRRPWVPSSVNSSSYDTTAYRAVNEVYNMDYTITAGEPRHIDVASDYRLSYAMYPFGIIDGVAGIHRNFNYMTPQLGVKSGPYVASQDQTQDVWDLLDSVGLALMDSNNILRDRQNNHTGYLPGYQVSRHDYT